MPRKNKDEFSAIESRIETGTDMLKSKFEAERVKVRGLTGSGRTTFALGKVLQAKKLGYSPEDTLIGILDWDVEGQRRIIQQFLPEFGLEDYGDSILKIKCGGVEESFDTLQFFLQKLIKHMGEYEKDEEGNIKRDKYDEPIFNVRDDRFGVLILEDEGSYYQMTQDDYSKSTRGRSLREQMMKMQEQAVKETEASKKAGANKKVFKPIFEEGQMHSFKVINANFFELFNMASRSSDRHKFSLYVTTREKWKTLNWGDENQHDELAETGRPDKINGMFEFIIRMLKIRKDNKYMRIAQINKSRSSLEFPEGSTYKIKRNGCFSLWNEEEREEIDIDLPRLDRNWIEPRQKRIAEQKEDIEIVEEA